MGVRSVYYWPNPNLMEVADEVTLEELSSPAFKELIQDMVDTCAYGRGVGLAAPQIGIKKQVILIPGSDNSPLILVNPKLFTDWEDHTHIQYEAEVEYCLSFPNIPVKVNRPKDIKVSAQTVNGEAFASVLTGVEARIVQHEFDHLFGRTLADYIGSTRRSMLSSKIKKSLRVAKRIVKERTNEVSELKKAISQEMTFKVKPPEDSDTLLP